MPINTLPKHKIAFVPAGGLVRMGFGGTVLKLLRPLMLEAELLQQIAASRFFFRVIFSLKMSLAYH